MFLCLEDDKNGHICRQKKIYIVESSKQYLLIVYISKFLLISIDRMVLTLHLHALEFSVCICLCVYLPVDELLDVGNT
jgi:hypothetical protein